MYTPAVTMVAAWISALTGVGPAMASGSQTYKGICADLPVAPTSSRREIAVKIRSKEMKAEAITTAYLDRIKMLSDHRSGSFGEAYGTLIKDLRIESRAIFVLDKNNVIRHVEYVKEVAEHPNYDAALSAARTAAASASA